MLEIEDFIPKLKEKKKLLIQGAHSPVPSIREGIYLFIYF